MTINPTNASQAYLNTVRTATGSGLEHRNSGGDDFGSLLEKAVKSAVASTKQAEAASIKGLAGSNDLAEVVTAVASAEVALQTVITIRDRVIQAYQEIVRMPI